MTQKGASSRCAFLLNNIKTFFYELYLINHVEAGNNMSSRIYINLIIFLSSILVLWLFSGQMRPSAFIFSRCKVTDKYEPRLTFFHQITYNFATTAVLRVLQACYMPNHLPFLRSNWLALRRFFTFDFWLLTSKRSYLCSP